MNGKGRRALLATAAVLVLASSDLQAQRTIRSTGIGLRGTYWGNAGQLTEVSFSSREPFTSVYTGGGGGWISFFSRVDDDWTIEFSLGAVATEIVESSHPFGEDVDVSGIVPVVLGLRHDLLPIDSPSALRPYVALGGGPYWFANVRIRERLYEEEVTVETRLKAGAYAGGGMNFMLTSWFGINFDVRYHFVDLNLRHERSGFEYGLGVQLMWGRYKPQKRN